jgi:hypothetical protein
MPYPDPSTVFDAERMSAARTVLPTDLSTAELRELGADVLGRSVFTARGTNAVFVSKLKEVIDSLAAGQIGEGQARTAIYEVLDALGYDAERGGFQGEEVPPALRGTLQDLRSYRRVSLIVDTQLKLMQGAGLLWRGQQEERVAAFPAWELVRVEPKAVPRDWPSRWVIAGGRMTGNRMIALKGDPVWGELGSYENFNDALGVDHPPFAFQSGMGWREIPAAEVRELGVTGPEGETPEEFFDSRPVTSGGKPALPVPRMSLDGMDAEVARKFVEETQAVPVTGRPGLVDYSDLLAAEIAKGGGQ